MFANLIAAPFVLGAILMLYLSWEVDEKYAIWIVPLVVIAAVIYVFSPQINWWRYRRKPPVMEPALAALLEKYDPFYRRLNAADKKKFRDRVVLFRMAVEWMPMGWPDEELPPDVQVALSAQAVTVTFGKPEFLFPKFEQVIVYPYPFPSPEYPFAHASELYEADGCLLFSAEQLMVAFMEPGKWYNIGLHEYARVFKLAYPNLPYPAFAGDDVWEKLQTVAGGLTRDLIEATVGLAGVDVLPVAIHHYFVFPQRFRTVFPEESAVFDTIF